MRSWESTCTEHQLGLPVHCSVWSVNDVIVFQSDFIFPPRPTWLAGEQHWRCEHATQEQRRRGNEGLARPDQPRSSLLELLCIFFKTHFFMFFYVCAISLLWKPNSSPQFVEGHSRRLLSRPSNNFSYRVSQKRCTIECCWNYRAKAKSSVAGIPLCLKKKFGVLSY